MEKDIIEALEALTRRTRGRQFTYEESQRVEAALKKLTLALRPAIIEANNAVGQR